jgi:Transcription factor WhiB
MAAAFVTQKELDAILAVYTAHGTGVASKWAGKGTEWVRHRARDAGLNAGKNSGQTAEMRARIAPRYDCECGSCADYYAAGVHSVSPMPTKQLTLAERRLRFVNAVISNGSAPAKLDLVADDNWQQHALCKGCDPSIWCPDSPESHTVPIAQRICAACPVSRACLQWANKNLHGINERGGVIYGGRYLTTRNVASTMEAELAA